VVRRSVDGPPIWFVIPAAGSGQRFAADAPKQFLIVAGKSVLQHTLESLLAHPQSAGAVVVLPANQRHSASLNGENQKPILNANGGKSRAESVLSGLQALPEDLPADALVAVHDAARPCIPTSALTELFAKAAAHPIGAIWAQALTDTITRARPVCEIVETLDRRELWRAQTPQIFRLAPLKSALLQSLADDVVVSDEAQAMERLGFYAELVQCPVENIKLTHSRDLPALERFFREKTAPQEPI